MNVFWDGDRDCLRIELDADEASLVRAYLFRGHHTSKAVKELRQQMYEIEQALEKNPSR